MRISANGEQFTLQFFPNNELVTREKHDSTLENSQSCSKVLLLTIRKVVNKSLYINFANMGINIGSLGGTSPKAVTIGGEIWSPHSISQYPGQSAKDCVALRRGVPAGQGV